MVPLPVPTLRQTQALPFHCSTLLTAQLVSKLSGTLPVVPPPASPVPAVTPVIVPAPGNVCPAANVNNPPLPTCSPGSVGALVPTPNNRFNVPEAEAVLLPAGSARQLNVWVTAVAVPLLNADAARFSGCEFFPPPAVAVPVAGSSSVPRTRADPATSSFAARVCVPMPRLRLLFWNRMELPKVVPFGVHRGMKSRVPVPASAGVTAGWAVAAELGAGLPLAAGGGRRGQHESRWRQTADSLRIRGFQGIGHAEQQHARLFRLSFRLHSQPERLPSGEDIRGQAVTAGGTQHHRVVPVLVGLHVLSLHPQRHAALRIFVQKERDAHHPCSRSAGRRRQFTAEIHQRRHCACRAGRR